MPFNNTLLNIGVSAMQAAATHAAIGDGPTSGDETSAARQAISWEVAANGDFVLVTDENFTGTPGAGATHVLFFSASTAGTFYGDLETVGDQDFNAAGEYNLTGITVVGTAS